MTHSELETKAREILKAIKQHCSPTYDRGDGHGQPGSILWRSSEPYVIAILAGDETATSYRFGARGEL